MADCSRAATGDNNSRNQKPVFWGVGILPAGRLFWRADILPANQETILAGTPAPQNAPHLTRQADSAQTESGPFACGPRGFLPCEPDCQAIRNGIDKWHLPFYNAIMKTHIKMDKAGRVILPKPVRDAFCLQAGDSLEINSHGNTISLQPVRNTSPLHKERGIWVYRTGRPVTAAAIRAVQESVHQDREEKSLRSK